MEIKQTEVLSPEELSRGPDILRPGTPRCIMDPDAKTFIYTKYDDEEGNRRFCEAGEVGHEHIISRPRVLRALFGPKFKEIEAKISLEKEIYQCDPATGLPILNDHGLVVVGKEKFWDHWKIRFLTRETNLYGRAEASKAAWRSCFGWPARIGKRSWMPFLAFSAQATTILSQSGVHGSFW
jgi:hypothetical protein